MLDTTLPSSRRVLALLVRHGRTGLNAKKRLRAWEDVSLSEEGKMDAYIAANRLKIYRPKMVYSSDLVRDTETAMIIAELCGNVPYETDFALRTADVGSLSGMKEEDVRDRITRWYATPWEPAPSGESLNNFAKRFWQYYEAKLNLSRDVAAFRPSVFVTHGRNIAYADSSYRGIPPGDALMPLPGGIAVIRTDTDGLDTMEFISDTEPVIEDA